MSLTGRPLILVILIVILLIAGYFGFYAYSMRDIETPDYQVLQMDGHIEIRRYPALLVAEVTTSGNRSAAINQGFRQLAGFIFGGNHQPQSSNSTKIAMTAPVRQQLAQSTKIAMTAPVQQQAGSQSNQWITQFVMPAHFSKESLPVPTNAEVRIKTIPSTDYLVIRFSGRMRTARIEQYRDQLLAYAQSHQLPITGEPTYAFYNPPWTLPFMRRNEVMVALKRQQ